MADVIIKCFNCHKEVYERYCPWCGADLRTLYYAAIAERRKKKKWN